MQTQGTPIPLTLEPPTFGSDLPSWVAQHRDEVRTLLHEHGAMLFRGSSTGDVDHFRDFMTAASGSPLPYLERSSPRHEVAGHIYTSTDYPPDSPIYLHNEQSYNLTWPRRIFFHCVIPPGARGGTPIADCRRVYARISPAVRDRLEQREYMYVRHFSSDLGLSWSEAFQTDDRKAVERYCDNNGIRYEWDSEDELTTRQVRPVSQRHPDTGEPVWFNHLTFFHLSTLSPALAAALMSLGQDKLPNNTYYGDGSDIELEVLDELRAAYAAETTVVKWQAGDILMLDNMLVAHGREPFTPPRQIVVGMTEPYRPS